MKRKKSSRHDIYNRITGQIVTALEQRCMKNPNIETGRVSLGRP